jgi:DNA polymerase III alpha subunit (gram-positive type)
MRVVKMLDIIIKLPESVHISKKITNITGITKEQCNLYGSPIQDGLREFYYEYTTCDYIVGHNVGFDKKMIKIEILRHLPELIVTCPNIEKCSIKSTKRAWELLVIVRCKKGGKCAI